MSNARREVIVAMTDVNDVDVDVLAVPIEGSLAGGRRVAQALLAQGARGGEQSPRAVLDAVRARHPEGLPMGTVVLVPAGPGTRARRIAFVVLLDDRPGIVDTEPDDARVALGAEQLFGGASKNGVTSCALVPFAGIDMHHADAARLAARALASHWSHDPLSPLQKVVFIERTAKRTEEIWQEILRVFPDAQSPISDASTVEAAPVEVAPAAASLDAPADEAADRAPPGLSAPPPGIVPFGLNRKIKHSIVAEIETWGASCSGPTPIPVGCSGFAFRVVPQRGEATFRVRISATPPFDAWLDEAPLDSPRVRLAPGLHVLAIESGGGLLAIELEPVDGAENTRARLIAVADGAVAATTAAPRAGWRKLDGPHAGFTPVFDAVDDVEEERLPEWCTAALRLPRGPRVWTRFTFPVVTMAVTR